jgi:hypothetical protein
MRAFNALSPDCRNYQSGRTTNKTLHSRCQSAGHAKLEASQANCVNFGSGKPGGTKPDGGDRRDRTDDLKLAKLPLSQLSYVPAPKQSHHAKSASNNPRKEYMVGLGRLELPTSRLSSARSNQLSYRPERVQALHKRPEERET